MPQELETVAAFPARIGVGEMHSDVSRRDGAENRVGDGVRENVRVGMPGETELGWNGDTAEDQRTSGGDAMNVPALSDVDRVNGVRFPARRRAGRDPYRWGA